MAFKNEYDINVDLKIRLSSVVPTFKQGETGLLRFKVFDNGKEFDMAQYTSSEIIFTLPSGKHISGIPNLVNGKLEYSFTGLEIAERGYVHTQLIIRSGATNVAIQPFNCVVYETMEDRELTYVGLLQELMKECQELGIDMRNIINGFDSFDYSPTQTFDFPNLVLFDGSTYIALKEVTGIEPNDDKVNWRLVAQKGETPYGFDIKENDGEVYVTFTRLPFEVDTNGDVFYVGDGGNAGASFGDELYVWKVVE